MDLFVCRQYYRNKKMTDQVYIFFLLHFFLPEFPNNVSLPSLRPFYMINELFIFSLIYDVLFYVENCKNKNRAWNTLFDWIDLHVFIC